MAGAGAAAHTGFPAPILLLVFLIPLSPAESWRIPWRGSKGGGNKVGTLSWVVHGWCARSCSVGPFGGTEGAGVQVLYTKVMSKGDKKSDLPSH